MDSSTQTIKTLKGAEWLIKESKPEDIFIPEDFNEEQQMVKDMCESFWKVKCFPFLKGLIKWNPDLCLRL